MSGDALAWTASITLGAVLVAAGVVKLSDRARWSAQVSALGIDGRLAAFVPWLELVTGAAVATRAAHPLGPLVALAVLTTFTVWLVVQVRRGVAAPCACFGGFTRRPVSWRDVARNVVLLGLAAVALGA